jgi:tRNA nucleotidyltransferase/poly(A) polymerase
VLRAYRFSAVHGLRFGPGLAGLLRDHADLLNGVSPERVRYELFRLLDGDYASLALRRTVDDGVLEVLFPFLSHWKGFDQGSYHAHDLLEHSLQAVENIERVLADERLEDFAEKLALHFDETLEADITRLSLLKWVGFFHDVAKPETLTIEKSGRRRFIGHDLIGGQKAESLLGSMRVGNRAAHAASRIIAAHMRLFGLAHQEKPTERSRLRYLADLSDEAPEAVILSLADEIATGEREPGERDAFWRTVAELLNLYFNREEKPQPLIRGRDLVAGLGMAQGAEVGLILAAVADAETQGLVSTREEALEYAGRMLKRG